MFVADPQQIFKVNVLDLSGFQFLVDVEDHHPPPIRKHVVASSHHKSAPFTYISNKPAPSVPPRFCPSPQPRTAGRHSTLQPTGHSTALKPANRHSMFSTAGCRYGKSNVHY
ncbi:hypothetical protein QQF64_008741 [Cirrhinus molitorella]|uniref:Transcription factor Tbx4 n=1 Tax=Cirrhinus molitorella TaxID=172907 RepID=A0ABR3M718_9TELE